MWDLVVFGVMAFVAGYVLALIMESRKTHKREMELEEEQFQQELARQAAELARKPRKVRAARKLKPSPAPAPAPTPTTAGAQPVVNVDSSLYGRANGESSWQQGS